MAFFMIVIFLSFWGGSALRLEFEPSYSISLIGKQSLQYVTVLDLQKCANFYLKATLTVLKEVLTECN